MGTNRHRRLSENQISVRTVSFPGCIAQPSALANSIRDNTNLTWHLKKKSLQCEKKTQNQRILPIFPFGEQEYFTSKWSLDSIREQKSV